MIAKYYSKIKITTLSRLIGVSEDRAELELGDMVVNKRILAKINRLAWEVTFKKKNTTANAHLNDWNADIKTLLDKVEQNKVASNESIKPGPSIKFVSSQAIALNIR